MNISPVNFSSVNYINNKSNTKTSINSDINKIKCAPLPTVAQYLSFTGGKSLDLSLTKAQIEKFGSFPPDIKENIEKELEKGNPDNKTLIDIHKEKYEDLSQLDSLDEIKFFYPEFKDVLSDSKVDYRKNSFMDDAKNGLVKGIDPNSDLAVQLLQLYWGEGFSLNDLKEQFGGRSLDGILNKLNIPKSDKVYGHYLKFSDKEYNARLTSKMSERQQNISRNKMIKREGVFIPRGPLTEEHKKHISEGLKRYYSENPDKVYDMSERQTKYYEEHPEEKEILSEVLKRAWGYSEAKTIKKAITKFVKKEKLNANINEMIMSPNNETMKKFWNRNTWAKEQFSKCMKKSWVRQKELGEIGLIKEPLFRFKQVPTKLLPKYYKYAEKIGIKDFDNYLYSNVAYDEKEGRYKVYNKFSEKLFNASDIVTDKEIQDAGDAMISSVALALLDMKRANKNGNCEKYKGYNYLLNYWRNNLNENNKEIPMGLRYNLFIKECLDKGYMEELKLLTSKLDFAYQKACLGMSEFAKFYEPLLIALFKDE